MMQTVVRLNSLLENDERMLVVTGWDVDDGTAELSLQIALGLASVSQQTVLLVDADFRAPILHERLQTQPAPGLGELIEGGRQFADLVTPFSDGSFFFLPAGTSAAVKAGELATPAWISVLANLRNFQRVVLNVGPLSENPASMVITAESDGVILGLAAGIRRRDEVEDLQRQVEMLRAKLLGAVLTYRQ
jgi:Mrp family chromosome partitioning ATPase